jgi:predicted PurR-regulated permease PerM
MGGTDGAQPMVNSNRVPLWVVQVSTISWSFVGAAAGAAIVVFALGALRQLVIPLMLSGFLAVVFAPAVSWLEDRRVPRAVGAVLVLLMINAIAIGAIAAVVVGVVDQADNLKARFDDVVAEIDNLIQQSDAADSVDAILSSVEASGSLLGEGLGSTIGSVVGTTGGFVSGLILGAVLLYYLLKDGPSLIQNASRSDDPERRVQTARILEDAAASIRAYVKGRTILALIQASLIGIISAVAGVPLAFAIALVNLIGAYIPYIGGLVGGAFAVLMALSVGGPRLALIMLVVVLVVSVGLENLLEPALLGDKLRMHPIAILFATVAGGLVVGIVGMFLAAPLLAIARTLWQELRASGFFSQTRVQPSE